jgi:feruloyl esterase
MIVRREMPAILFPVLMSMILVTAAPVAAATCESLGSLALPNAAVTSVEAVPESDFTLSGGRGGPRAITDLPAFCRVEATLSPTSESEIRIELWMPSAQSWNGKYLAVGNGAFAGSIGTNAMLEPLRRGYATSSTDTGHSGNQGAFALNEEKLIDFAYRAVHEMAVQSKVIIDAFYETGGPQYSFFNGCSTGGRQALAAAQRYPMDFDGIVAGAAANYPTHLQGAQLWMGRLGPTTDGGAFGTDKLRFLHEAAIESCDMADGVKDSVIENPDMCRFSPTDARYGCVSGEGDSCLTETEAQMASRIYQGPRSSSGQSIFSGLAQGSELGWGGMIGTEPMSLAVDTFRYFVHKDESWDYESFDVESEVELAEQVVGDTMDSMDPDIRRFISTSGKLLMYHGWADPGISPYNSVSYYRSVVDRIGSSVTESLQLFMVPGMGHCRGGEGPDTFDTIAVIDAWVETGDAPDRIIASRIRNGEVDRTRPLCAFPQTAVYDGSGSTDDESNFICR